MNKAYSTFICFIAALLLVGVTANAGMNRGRAVLSGVAALSAGDNDSTSAAKNDTATIDDVPEESIVDEVIWVVGDEPILKSDVEMMRLQAEQEGMTWHGNPDCAIPEQLALQKLFRHRLYRGERERGNIQHRPPDRCVDPVCRLKGEA